ncbi:MAG TPA: hypothetical protein VF113_00570 [Stellaceae bacterium]
MWRPLASLVLALLVTMVLAAAAAWGVLEFMRLTNLLPQPPLWLIFAVQAMALALMFYGWRRKRRGSPKG